MRIRKRLRSLTSKEKVVYQDNQELCCLGYAFIWCLLKMSKSMSDAFLPVEVHSGGYSWIGFQEGPITEYREACLEAFDLLNHAYIYR